MRTDSLIYVVDDDQAVRTAITDLVEDMGCKASPYANAEDFLDSISEEVEGHCLVLDIRMPGMSGIELLNKLHQKKIILPVILVTGHGDIPMTVEALKLGAVDVLEKPFREQILWEKIKNALEIGAEKINQKVQKDAFMDNVSRLKPKERRVIKFLLEGKNDKVIAHEIGVTRRAVAFQRTNALNKLEVSGIVELAQVISGFQIEF
jgi:two-component system response regulator FixJ